MTNMTSCSGSSDDPVVGICSSEKSVEDANSSSLPYGTLSVLPREIRLQIWEDVLLGTDKRNLKELGISSCLRLNKAVHHEATSALLYHQEVVFVISPHWPRETFRGVSLWFINPIESSSSFLYHSYHASGAFSEATTRRLECFQRTP